MVQDPAGGGRARLERQVGGERVEVGHVAVSEEEVVAGAVHIVSHLGAEDTAASLTRRRTAILPPPPHTPDADFQEEA